MSLFNTIPWKTIASFMPTVMELVRDAKGGDKGLIDLQCRIEQLEHRQKIVAGRLQLLLGGVVAALVLAAAALVLGVIAVARL
jgi:hypothetical protein